MKSNTILKSHPRLAILALILLGTSTTTMICRMAGQQSPATAPQNGVPSAGEEKSEVEKQKTAMPSSSENLRLAMNDILLQLESPNTTDEQRADLMARLRSLLLGSGKDEAIAAILEFLATGRDAKTGEAFLVGTGGVLDGAPMVRVALLDVLGRLCREAGTMEALTMVQEILATFGSADEWAVCMRNTAWLDPNSKSYLASKVSQMLSHEPWLKAPSAGFFEAFDVIVHTSGLDLAPSLAAMGKSEDGSFAQAATVALDRLAENNSQKTAELINNQPELFQDQTGLRSSLMAKGDPASAALQAQWERYLTRQDVSVQEKQQFLDSILTQSGFLSNNLITPSAQPATLEADVARINQVAEVLERWQADSRLTELAPDLERRLEQIDSIAKEIAQGGGVRGE